MPDPRAQAMAVELEAASDELVAQVDWMRRKLDRIALAVAEGRRTSVGVATTSEALMQAVGRYDALLAAQRLYGGDGA